MRHVPLLVVAPIVAFASYAVLAAEAPDASKTLEQIGTRRGVCLWVGAADAARRFNWPEPAN